MSWFDTAGIANLAKTALKEAQKTIDKALDIRDEEPTSGIAPKETSDDDLRSESIDDSDNVSPEVDSDSFFASWGLKTSGTSNSSGEIKSPASPSAENEVAATSNSIWGSFTGSFFDASGIKLPDAEKYSTDSPVSRQPQKSALNLTTSQESADSSQGWVSTEEGGALSDEDGSPEKFHQTKLVVQSEPDSPLETSTSTLLGQPPAKTETPNKPPGTLSLIQRHLPKQTEPLVEVISLRKAVSSGGNNRLSIISSSTGSPDTSGADSVEVIGSTSEDSTSPETQQIVRVGVAGARHSFLSESSPESVGVLGGCSGDSSNFTSPSSVEVIGWSEANSPCSPAGPPVPRPFPGPGPQTLLRRHHGLLNSSRGISPDDSEALGGLQEEETDDISYADDSSCSSATTATVLEPKPPPAAAQTPVVSTVEPLSSPQVRSLLAEAMEEHELQAAREHSPISSESRSETATRQGSGHTSGDELETTTTSSDIEIISSPNGDGSSSTHSARHSPAKMPVHSHPQLLNTARVMQSFHNIFLEEDGFTNETLLKKLSDMSSVLEARELRLVELSRANIDLQQINDELNRQIESGRIQAAAQDMSHVTEEFTQRLSALERKFQQAIRERDVFKKQMEEARQEAAAHASCSQMQALLAEREEEARELREEGEKLSKQQLQLSTLVKKLRAKEKETETQAKNHKQQISDLGQETERLRRSLGAKEGVERSQIEAVDRLTAQLKRNERELSIMTSELAETSAAKDKLQNLLDAVNQDVKNLRSSQMSAELAQQATLSSQLAEAEARAKGEQVAHEAAMEQLRGELAVAAEASSRREEALRKEQASLLRRLTAAEARADELEHSATDATRPLLLQLQALQSGVVEQQAASDRAERSLADRLAEAQARLASASELERQAREQYTTLTSQVATLQSELTTLTSSSRDVNLKYHVLEAERDQLASELTHEQSTNKEEIERLRREVSSLRDQLAVQQAAAEAEKRHRVALQAELQRQPVTPIDPALTVSVSTSLAQQSPTPPRSPGSLMTESFGSLNLQRSWPHEELHEALTAETSGPSSSPAAHQLEALQSQLKRRDGELTLLRSETRKLELQRSELTKQVGTLAARADSQAAELARLGELERKYDALLQMYGEQLEANQELRLDLDDVKEMYRIQIEALIQAQQQQQPPAPV